MAIFDDPQRLWSALDELVLEGVGLRRLCVVASRSALASISDWRGRRKRAGLRTVQVDEPIQDDGMVTALWAAVIESLFAGRPPAGQSSDCVKETLPTRLFKNIKQNLQSGGYVLLASSSTPVQHDRVSRILLTRGTGRLFTHEFTRRQSKSGGKRLAHK